jgi:hypothetical protein
MAHVSLAMLLAPIRARTVLVHKQTNAVMFLIVPNVPLEQLVLCVLVLKFQTLTPMHVKHAQPIWLAATHVLLTTNVLLASMESTSPSMVMPVRLVTKL